MKNLSLKCSILGEIFVMPPHSSSSNLLDVEWAWFFRARAEVKLLNIEPGWAGASKIRSYITWVFYAEPHWTFGCIELLLLPVWSSFCLTNCESRAHEPSTPNSAKISRKPFWLLEFLWTRDVIAIASKKLKWERPPEASNIFFRRMFNSGLKFFSTMWKAGFFVELSSGLCR